MAASQLAQLLAEYENADLPVPGEVFPTPERDLNSILSVAGARLNDKLEGGISGLLNAVMAPGAALQGEYNQRPIFEDGSVGQFDQRMIEDATNLAGVVSLGAMPLPRPSNSLGMFGGVRAQTADRAALARAQDLWDEGYPLDDIRAQTGWFRGADEQWRFEIPDDAAQLRHTNVPMGDAPDVQQPASSVLSHDALYSAYPELADMSTTARLQVGDAGGWYAPPRTVGNRMVEGIEGQAPTRPDLKSVLLHEMQHAIQQREGFDLGGSPSMYQQQADATLAMKAMSWRREIARKRQQMPNASDEAIDAAIMAEYAEMGAPDWVPPKEARQVAFDTSGNPDDQLQQVINLYGLDQATTPHSPMELYHRTAGEVEARNVQTRMDMTPEQRSAQPPWATQDVPDNLQIIRMLIAGGGR